MWSPSRPFGPTIVVRRRVTRAQDRSRTDLLLHVSVQLLVGARSHQWPPAGTSARAACPCECVRAPAGRPAGPLFPLETLLRALLVTDARGGSSGATSRASCWFRTLLTCTGLRERTTARTRAAPRRVLVCFLKPDACLLLCAGYVLCMRQPGRHNYCTLLLLRRVARMYYYSIHGLYVELHCRTYHNIFRVV
jgi:hypothetical protein